MKAGGVQSSLDDVVDNGVSGKLASAETIRKRMKAVRLDSILVSTLVCKTDVEVDPKGRTVPQGLVVQSGPKLGKLIGSYPIA